MPYLNVNLDTDVYIDFDDIKYMFDDLSDDEQLEIIKQHNGYNGFKELINEYNNFGVKAFVDKFIYEANKMGYYINPNPQE